MQKFCQTEIDFFVSRFGKASHTFEAKYQRKYTLIFCCIFLHWKIITEEKSYVSWSAWKHLSIDFLAYIYSFSLLINWTPFNPFLNVILSTFLTIRKNPNRTERRIKRSRNKFTNALVPIWMVPKTWKFIMFHEKGTSVLYFVILL